MANDNRIHDWDTERNIRRRQSRRRMQRRRRRQLQRRMILSGIVFVIILLFSSCAYRCAKKADAREAAKVEKAKKEEKEEQETEQERLERVRQEAQEAGYPAEIIELLSKNPETVGFVEDYGKKKDAPVKETVGDIAQGEIPYLYQWDEGWGYSPYGTSTVAVSGCGPTCMSMIISGLTGDNTVTPLKMVAYSEQYGHITAENDTTWAFMKEVAWSFGLSSWDIGLDESIVASELAQGHPVVCALGPGDFTQNGHFIVLAGYDNGNVTVHDPFSEINSEKTWAYADIMPQIRAIWAYSS